jgi:hypothetical protein
MARSAHTLGITQLSTGVSVSGVLVVNGIATCDTKLPLENMLTYSGFPKDAQLLQ